MQAPSSRSVPRRLLTLLTASALLLATTPSRAEPTFAVTVEVTFSAAAAASLSSLHEGIVVSATYAGDPKPSARKHADQVGRIDLGSEQVKAPGRPGTVLVTGKTVQRNRLAWVDGPINLNINVFSARRSGPDNILACDFFDGDLTSGTSKPVALHCSLIAEHTQTKALS